LFGIKKNIFLSVFWAAMVYLFFTQLLYAGDSDSNALAMMLQVENVVSNVAEKAGQAVVSISTARTAKINHYARSFGDDFFDQFLQDFFYEHTPQRLYKRVGLGSGVIINSDGYILTNEHVISGAEKITVTLPDGRSFRAKIKGSDYRLDLAVIKIEAENLPYVELGSSGNLKTGQWVIAVGNPFGFAVASPKPTVTFGIVSALQRKLPNSVKRNRDYSGLIQTDAAINPGNSGGPLLNIKGEIIGINVAIFSTSGGSDGIGFAIPIDAAKSVLEKLTKGEKILYGWLGIGVQDLNPALANYFGLKKARGVLVVKIAPDSPAQKAGFKEQDIIVKFNNQKVLNTIGFVHKVQNSDVGDKINVKVSRNNILRNLKVKIGKMTESPEIKQPQSKPVEPLLSVEQKWRGMTVFEISNLIAQRYGITKTSGVIVTKVASGSPAQEAGIVSGDIISQIESTVIRNINDYIESVNRAMGNVLVKSNRGYFILKSAN